MLSPTEPDDDRPPIWRQDDMLRRTAAAERLFPAFETHALTLGAADQRPASNCYLLQMGSLRSLRKHGVRVTERIQSVCGFCATQTDWPGVRRWLPQLVAEFFSSSPHGFGWYALLTARRPAQFRTDDDPPLCISQKPAIITHLAREDTIEGHLPVGKLDGVQFTRPDGVQRRQTPTTLLDVHRRIVWTNPCFPIDWEYVERWACIARLGEDDDRLGAGRLPAIPDSHYTTPDGRPVRVRDTVILNLVRCYELPAAIWKHQVLVVELHPREGSVLSVRRSNMPLGPGILCSPPIERAGIARTLLYG